MIALLVFLAVFGVALPSNAEERSGPERAKASAPLPRADRKLPDYFPLVAGSNYRYWKRLDATSDQFGNQESTVIISEVSQGKDGESISASFTRRTDIYMESTPNSGADHHIVRRKGSFIVNQTSVAQSLVDSATTTVVLHFPVALGASWDWSGGQSRITQVGATVSVPAGVFKDCVLVETEARVMGEMRKWSNVFAPGVGLIKGPLGELASFRVGPRR